MPTKQKLEGMVNDGQIPIVPINYDLYEPIRFGDYVQIADEVEELTQAIESGLPYLIEGEKGIGKTMLVTEVCAKTNTHLVSFSCSSGTTMGDIIGREHLKDGGSVYKLGVLPTAIEVANKTGKAVLYLDELNALEPEIQKMLNPVIDDRRSLIVNNRMFKLNDGVKFTIIASQNPSFYSGVNELNEDLRSRFVGKIMAYPTSSQIASVIDWKDIPEDEVKDPLLSLAVDTLSLKKSGKVSYVISIRDIALFTRTFRAFKSICDTPEKLLLKTIQSSILMKYTDTEERQLLSTRCADTFGINIPRED